jgi:hypothetical protein
MLRGYVSLCAHFHVITQEHDGVAAVSPHDDRLTVWSATESRVPYRFKMFILSETEWHEFRICLAKDDPRDFLTMIYRQRRKTKRRVTHIGWWFEGTPELESILHEWTSRVWPEIHSPQLDVTNLRYCIPEGERDAANSQFMLERLQQTFGWLSQLRS